MLGRTMDLRDMWTALDAVPDVPAGGPESETEDLAMYDDSDDDEAVDEGDLLVTEIDRIAALRPLPKSVQEGVAIVPKQVELDVVVGGGGGGRAGSPVGGDLEMREHGDDEQTRGMDEKDEILGTTKKSTTKTSTSNTRSVAYRLHSSALRGKAKSNPKAEFARINRLRGCGEKIERLLERQLENDLATANVLLKVEEKGRAAGEVGVTPQEPSGANQMPTRTDHGDDDDTGDGEPETTCPEIAGSEAGVADAEAADDAKEQKQRVEDTARADTCDTTAKKTSDTEVGVGEQEFCQPNLSQGRGARKAAEAERKQDALMPRPSCTKPNTEENAAPDEVPVVTTTTSTLPITPRPPVYPVIKASPRGMAVIGAVKLNRGAANSSSSDVIDWAAELDGIKSTKRTLQKCAARSNTMKPPTPWDPEFYSGGSHAFTPYP
eukprot:g15262.t1